MTGADLIQKERERQLVEEGFTAESDAKYIYGELGVAAECYITEARYFPNANFREHRWPWDKKWWKPGPTAIRMLTKAGALIAAEIDRRLRAGEKP